jgi:hypothetical protein
MQGHNFLLHISKCLVRQVVADRSQVFFGMLLMAQHRCDATVLLME